MRTSGSDRLSVLHARERVSRASRNDPPSHNSWTHKNRDEQYITSGEKQTLQSQWRERGEPAHLDDVQPPVAEHDILCRCATQGTESTVRLMGKAGAEAGSHMSLYAQSRRGTRQEACCTKSSLDSINSICTNPTENTTV